MTKIHEAREALGQRLRELRRDASLNGKGLAEALGWPASKVSKIELGKQTPSEADISAWACACGAPDAASALTAALRNLETQYAEWRRQLRDGTKLRQQALAEVDATTRTIRAFENTWVPGLLQTPEYARCRLAEVVDLYGIVNDIDAGVQARMERQNALYQPGRRFHFVITEAVLRYGTAPRGVMAGQIDRLMSATSLPSVRLGIVPFGVRLPVSPLHGFWLFDNRIVMVETSPRRCVSRSPRS
ncbi:helix-turn-helix transcriptional regulator [Streptomyces sp. NBC_00885]|uniref:helix-turn-helix domain-containing protein n=1 Tax=Streptomyces sp. NBC_00885 TaxID=2975857 RepID=UPI00386CA078|nr:helix-turn-helix transcriptional regulator [Streptomyces sp. NBC_00885]